MNRNYKITAEMERAGVAAVDRWEDQSSSESLDCLGYSDRCAMVADIFRTMTQEAERQAPGPTIAPSAEPPK